jgi:hypothetical protein
VCDNPLNMSGKIDDPADASFEAWPEEPEGLGRTFGELAFSFTSLVFPPAAVLKILTDQFLPANRFKRIDYLLRAVSIGLKGLEAQVGADREKMKEIQTQIEAPRFQEAVSMACEEAARASDTKKVKRLAAVLTGSLTPSQWTDPNADLAAMVRDVAQLGEQDIHALDILTAVFASVINYAPNLNDPNAFTERMQDYRTAIAQAQIQPDDFYGSCARLNGFGLAIEVVRNSSRMQLDEYCFRPTRRGLALLDSLERFRSAGERT